MKTEITEDEMILEFLQGEIDSPRFQSKIIEGAEKLGINIRCIKLPNRENPNENKERRALLEYYRKFSSRQGLFGGFPTDVRWYRQTISKSEFENSVFYINYDYWNELSKGTSLPKVAAETIKEGIEVFGKSNAHFLQAAQENKNGKQFPLMILAKVKDRYVIVEGHLRATAYALNLATFPDTIEVIVGYSDSLNNWE
jgi:hypothetical protein